MYGYSSGWLYKDVFTFIKDERAKKYIFSRQDQLLQPQLFSTKGYNSNGDFSPFPFLKVQNLVFFFPQFTLTRISSSPCLLCLWDKIVWKLKGRIIKEEDVTKRYSLLLSFKVIESVTPSKMTSQKKSHESKILPN
ncbi:hypothetical protein Ocin01_02122 [Orchesella cincta]|uniref:Uncharacterized protein n=1 Tax=Orchesella cincta TaxID=48709 RepID=A0A1D2NH18_ORCCI|nr:hypothetical protein Ocin01_02122 [Orchesella cincta]